MINALIILHRALQEEEISQMVAHRIKEKENLLYPCQNEDQSYDDKMLSFICDLYINYLKSLVNFIIICQLFSISLKDLHHYSKSLKPQELFMIFNRTDTLIENILKVFEQKSVCQNYSILHNVIHLIFLDLLKIYQSYYLLITVMLEMFESMELRDAKRAFIIYLNFLKIHKEIRRMTSCVSLEFNIKLNIYFYEVDSKVIEGMKLYIETQEKSGKVYSINNSKIIEHELLGTTENYIKLDKNLIFEKLEYHTEVKKKRRQTYLTEELQGFQGMQRIDQAQADDVHRVVTMDYAPFVAKKYEEQKQLNSHFHKQSNLMVEQNKIRQKMIQQFSINELILQKYFNSEVLNVQTPSPKQENKASKNLLSLPQQQNEFQLGIPYEALYTQQPEQQKEKNKNKKAQFAQKKYYSENQIEELGFKPQAKQPDTQQQIKLLYSNKENQNDNQPQEVEEDDESQFKSIIYSNEDALQ